MPMFYNFLLFFLYKNDYPKLLIIIYKTVSVDDNRIVAWRKSNKVGIKARAKLNCDLKSGTEIVTGFALRFLYTNTVPSLEQREIQTSEVTIPVFVVLGVCDS